MPSRPYQYQSDTTTKEPLFVLTDLAAKVTQTEAIRQESFDTGRKLQIALVKAKIETDSSTSTETDNLKSLVAECIPTTADRTPRENFLVHQIENYVQFQAFQHFLDTGKLLSPSACPYATDEEYLAGACMGLCEELARYGRGRATARDISSVKMASNLVSEILEYLLQFNFRNGPLRRKYDGTKYSLRTLEMLLYELSVTGLELQQQGTDTAATTSNNNSDEQETTTSSSSFLLIPNDELTQLRERVEHRDDLRETLIKRCRDGQKSAKQSIYALHRGDQKRAVNLLNQCQNIINKDLLPIVQEEPGLRYGSYANLLEEYAEAQLFHIWLNGENNSSGSGETTTTTTERADDAATTESSSKLGHNMGTLLQPEEFQVELDPGEYLGGLCDLTGEVGRYAVQRATARDAQGVKLCLQTNNSILMALQMMERLPGGVGKKMDQVRRSVDKLERILYEMSLSDATGGRNVHANDQVMMDIEPKNNNNQDQGDDE